MNSFETERLLLQPVCLQDAIFYLELMNTPKWFQYIGDRNLHSVEDAEAYIQHKILSIFEGKQVTNYTVMRKIDKVKIGNCGLYHREGFDGVDIGFAFLPDYEGKGFAFEAASKVLQLAFENFGMNAVRAYTTEDNLDSIKLIEKLGLKRAGKVKFKEDKIELLNFVIEKGD